MNPETAFLVDRQYPELRDDLLTALVGGVVNEPIVFDDRVNFYRLSQATRDVRTITGTVTQENPDGIPTPQRYTFQKEIDYQFSEGDNAIVWQTGGTVPDDDTVFYVDYFLQTSQSPLTDINVGSVSRTICEAIGREIATVYQQINQAYRSGFIDTAEGQSLDFVVSILGIVRKRKGGAIGTVTFFRDPRVEGGITIDEGALLSTTKGEATFITSQRRTLQPGQVRIDVPIAASEKSPGEAGLVKAGAITTLVQPIAGIARITNFDATALGTEDETDEALRARARAALRASGKGTLAALAKVIFEEGAVLTEVWDPNSPPAKQAAFGTVKLLIESEPERFPSLRSAVEETRAAGIQTTLVARYIYIKPRLMVRLVPGLPPIGKTKVIDGILSALQTYVEGLSSGDAIKGEDLLAAIAPIKGIAARAGGKPDIRLVDVAVWRTDLAKAGGASLTDALLTAIQGVPANDLEAQRAAIARVLEEDAPSLIPTGQRIPDRSLIKGPSGAPAKDGEIEAGQFEVTATVNGEPWWIVLEMDAADLVVLEAEG